MSKPRGRKSAASELLTVNVPVSVDARIPIPDHLTPDQEAVFRQVVNVLPARFFSPEQSELLAMYARHVVTARMMSAEIDRWRLAWFSEDGGLDRFDRMSKLRDRETKAALAAARALRLTNQSRIQPRGAARMAEDAASAVRPWE